MAMRAPGMQLSAPKYIVCGMMNDFSEQWC